MTNKLILVKKKNSQKTHKRNYKPKTSMFDSSPVA